MENWYWFLGLAGVAIILVIFVTLRIVIRRFLWPAIQQSRRDKSMLEHLRLGKGKVYAGTYGCSLDDSSSKVIITDYIFEKHSPKPCGMFFAVETAHQSPERQQEILICLVCRLKKLPFEYRTKFVGGAKRGELDYGGQASKEIGRKLFKMLDQVMPGWRGKD
jgi:hypothetical protein